MKYCVVLALTIAGLWAADQVKTANGVLEGTMDAATGVRMFKGVPFATPPVDELRWRPPQPPHNWTGVRKAAQFGPRCMQRAVFGDMNFRSSGMSEDCLYLNIWTPAKSAAERLPVLVYFFGGGFIAGDGSEPRYDGESLATKGIVAVTVNYRLDVFGFFAHPELTRESPHHASGDYGLMDQSAALKWVKANITAFGGDPDKITIGGESAGSLSVSAQMASPLSKGLIAGAIGESGSVLGTLSAEPLAKGEEQGLKFATMVGAKSLAALRAMSSDEVLRAAGEPGAGRFPLTVDGYFFPEAPAAIFESGKQAHVPLLAGWNSEEMTGRALLAGAEPNVENYEKAVRKIYGPNAGEILKAYGASGNDAVTDAATALASDRFIAYSTWRWIDLCAKTGDKPVYRYFFERPRPPMRPEMGNATAGLAGGVIRGSGAQPRPAPAPRGAVHSAEIEYALGNLSTNRVYAWTPDDYKVSQVMEDYFANFIKRGNPNGDSLPKWPALNAGGPPEVMHIGVESRAEPEQHRDRYLVMEKISR